MKGGAEPKIESTTWCNGPLKPYLNSNEVHVWVTRLSLVSDNQKEYLKQLLTENELKKFNRFHFQADKERFLIGRAALKEILARYLDKTPISIILEVDEFGKPYLKEGTLHFNISHSEDIVIFAISHCKTVGIDVEVCQSKVDYLAIARQFCTAFELNQLSQLPDEKRRLAFYRCWTRKEAFVKAISLGLYFPLSAVEVGFSSGEAGLHSISREDLKVNINEELLEQSYWRMEEINLENNNNSETYKDYIATLMVNKAYPKTCYWKWELGKQNYN